MSTDVKHLTALDKDMATRNYEILKSITDLSQDDASTAEVDANA